MRVGRIGAAGSQHTAVNPIAQLRKRAQDAEVPTTDQAKTQAWTRKAAQAKKVLEEYEAWKKTQKPGKK